MEVINVVCGIIFNGKNVLIARRREGKSMAGKWEFPGGKIEMGEDEITALNRELLEEFGMQVLISERLGENLHDYGDFSIHLVAYKCTFVDATFELTDHDCYKWVYPKEIYKFDMAEADIPLIDSI